MQEKVHGPQGSVALVTDGNDRLEQRCGRLEILVNDAFDKSELPTETIALTWW
jgi:hypothetical protein